MGRSRRGSGSGFTRSRRSSPPPPPAPARYGTPSYGGHSTMMMPRGPSFMGTMAAAAGGSMLGNAISHQLFSAPQPTSKEGIKEMQQVMEQSPCATKFDMYARCMEFNASNPTACQWVWDDVAQCRTEALEWQKQQQQQSPTA